MPQSTSPVNELVNSVETLQEAITNANEPTSAQVRDWKAKLIILYEKLVLIEASLDKENRVEVEPPVKAPTQVKTSDSQEQIDKHTEDTSLDETNAEKENEEGAAEPADLFETPSLNERFESEANELAEQLKKSPISDLRSAIGVNQRVSFIFELFENDSVAFDTALDLINQATDLDAAMEYMVGELRPKYHWDEKEELTAEFQELVSRRFL